MRPWRDQKTIGDPTRDGMLVPNAIGVAGLVRASEALHNPFRLLHGDVVEENGLSKLRVPGRLELRIESRLNIFAQHELVFTTRDIGNRLVRKISVEPVFDLRLDVRQGVTDNVLRLIVDGKDDGNTKIPVQLSFLQIGDNGSERDEAAAERFLFGPGSQLLFDPCDLPFKLLKHLRRFLLDGFRLSPLRNAVKHFQAVEFRWSC